MLLSFFLKPNIVILRYNINKTNMHLSTLKQILAVLENVEFQLENGTFVPEHFHITEIGLITKHFIDCGGTVRNEKVVNFQLWNADDDKHRLKPAKLLNIINLSEEKLGIEDAEIEVEYQSEIADLQTIAKYGLDFNGSHFLLKNKQTACLANDACGIDGKQKPDIPESNNFCCTPNAGSC